METKIEYKSYNANKTIEEFLYNTLEYKIKLQHLVTECQFYKYLLQAPIYKQNVINLFEHIEAFKSDLNTVERKASGLIEEVDAHHSQIEHKIKFKETDSDSLFIKSHETLEQSIYDLFKETVNFKTRMFQYLQSVINN